MNQVVETKVKSLAIENYRFHGEMGEFQQKIDFRSVKWCLA